MTPGARWMEKSKRDRLFPRINSRYAQNFFLKFPFLPNRKNWAFGPSSQSKMNFKVCCGKQPGSLDPLSNKIHLSMLFPVFIIESCSSFRFHDTQECCTGQTSSLTRNVCCPIKYGMKQICPDRLTFLEGWTKQFVKCHSLLPCLLYVNLAPFMQNPLLTKNLNFENSCLLLS